jgi:hypothetical protein
MKLRKGSRKGISPWVFHLMSALALFGTLLYGEDITIPLEGGKISIRDSRVIRINQKDLVPVLSFTAMNSTSADWDLEMRFDIIGQCNGTNANGLARFGLGCTRRKHVRTKMSSFR